MSTASAVRPAVGLSELNNTATMKPMTASDMIVSVSFVVKVINCVNVFIIVWMFR